ncbi:MAG TPA: hypothetical protein VF622_13865 [Segetibacter sp.]|jgi:ABC-type transport system involved in cytochrome c biogenesis permease subunit
MKEKLLVVAVLLTPMLWWVAYTLIEGYAKSDGEKYGLMLTCVFSAIIMFATCLAYLPSKKD